MIIHLCLRFFFSIALIMIIMKNQTKKSSLLLFRNRTRDRQSFAFHLHTFHDTLLKEGENMQSKSFYLWFISSLTLNAFGNSMMILAHIGSPPWTGAGQNIAAISPISIGISMIIMQLFALFLTYLMGTKLTIFTLVKSFLTTFIFSLLIDLFVYIYSYLYLPDYWWSRGLYAFIGINCIAAGVAMYIQLGSVLMPADYLLKALRRVTGNYAIGAILSQLIPIIISIIISLSQHQLMNGLGMGTIIYVLLNGFFIEFYSRHMHISNLKTTNPST